MRGTIQKIEMNNNKQLKFYGEIRGEDGRSYRFNVRNWADQSISLKDIPRFAEVEFELMEPTLSGWIYPKNITLTNRTEQAVGEAAQDNGPISTQAPRETVQNAPVQAVSQKNFMPTNHHHGMLQEFAYIKQNFIRLALMEIIPNLADTEFATESSVFWKIATTYNALQDEDFVFSGSGADESVTFPSGFETPEGEPILLLCKRNKIMHNPGIPIN